MSDDAPEGSSAYAAVRSALAAAIQSGPRAQAELVRITDETFLFMEHQQDVLQDEQLLELRILLAQAQTMIGRYFGM